MKNAPLIAGVILAFGFMTQVQSQQALAPSVPETITEITLEHKGCCGPCPRETVTFRLDGNHTYTGMANVGRIGAYKPRSPDRVFGVMVKVLERLDFFSLQSDYARSIGPQQTIITVKRGSGTKSVRVNEAMGESPIEMTIITAFIEKVISKIAWERVNDGQLPS